MANFENVRERVFTFALGIIQLSNKLPKSMSNDEILRQLIRSATSIGANLEEAAGAHSRNDFICGMNIAKKESWESNYWLRLLMQTTPSIPQIPASVKKSKTNF